MGGVITQNKLNLPNYEDLNRTLAAYFEVDGDTLQENLVNAFNLDEFEYINLRFLSSFINNQANLYSNTFHRTLDYEEQIDIDLLNNALQEAERYFHLFKRSAIFIDFKVENDYNYIRALDPTIYFIDKRTGNVFLDDGNHILLFEKLSTGVLVYFRENTGFQKFLGQYDTSKSIEENGFISTNKFLEVMPIVEWSYSRIPFAVKSQLVSLEENQITSISWGLYNANPKLLMQTVITSDMKITELSELFKAYGKVNKVVTLGSQDSMNVYDTGNISVLKDLLGVYKDIVTQKALTLGVDKNSIIVNDKVESGESKKVSLSYINSIRKNFMFSAKIFDRKVLYVMIKQLYKVSNYKGIVFEDIEIVRSKEDKISYANSMQEGGYWTFPEAYAYVHQISVDKAISDIKEKKLTPKNNFF